MLAFALRGVVLVVVLGWYSTSMWKMIDSYFKDRFDKYLKEEYIKNPKMKAHVESQTRVKVQPIEVIGAQKILSLCELDTCPVDNADSLETEESLAIEVEEKHLKAQEAQENIPVAGSDAERCQTKNRGKIDESSTEMDEAQRRRTKARASLAHGAPRKKKIKTITLTNEDFEEVKDNVNYRDYDFSEFEYEEEPPEGIPIEKLGFKPKADIGNLDRITEDEYCPISLDYEENCGETKKWP